MCSCLPAIPAGMEETENKLHVEKVEIEKIKIVFANMEGIICKI